MVKITKEIVWLVNFFKDMAMTIPTLVNFFCDNKVAMHIASNSSFHELIKHIEVNCHYVCIQHQAKLLQFRFVPSHQQLTDVFTLDCLNKGSCKL